MNEYRNFHSILANFSARLELLEKISHQVETYVEIFEGWSDLADKVGPAIALIDYETRNMLPIADELNALAKTSAKEAAIGLGDSQRWTRIVIGITALSAILIGLILSWMIGRSIANPLDRLATAMKSLAGGDMTVKIPGTKSADEIGVMARTVMVFRDNMIEREHLASDRDQATRERERRAETVSAAIASFQDSIRRALENLRHTAEHLGSSSTRLNNAADVLTGDSKIAESKASAASRNVTAAASAVEELATSIGHIASEATRSTDVAARAVSEAQQSAQTMNDLGEAASRIGRVVELIHAIAGQTNLLALNATIEAARAGEFGRGFAVVASEVKSLAAQTAKATDEIANQIGAIQQAVLGSTQGIDQVNAVIAEMSSIASSISMTMENQHSAVASIAEGVSQASLAAQTGAEAMGQVAKASTIARTTASDVKSLAQTLTTAAEMLDKEVQQFLSDVQAA
jgi:methyl-accepting chemotaxis protein